MCLVEAHSGLECRCPRHEVVDADDLLLVARADGGAAGVAVHAVPCRALAWVGVALQLRGQGTSGCFPFSSRLLCMCMHM